MSINSVFLVGNLTRDPELRVTASGNGVLSLNICVNQSRKNAEGQWEDYPNYFFLTMFGKRAESLSTWLHKGSKVAVQGHLNQNTWEKDGQKQSRTDIIVDQIELMSKKESYTEAETLFDNDIPF